MKKISKRKIAVIRGDGARECPFGLPITSACKCAGKSVHRMAPLDSVSEEEQKKTLTKANKLVYLYHKDGETCPYADRVLEEFEKSDCDFGDTGEGQKSTAFRGSPLYSQTFQGLTLNGLYGYPLGYYSDNSSSRNLFFGLFSYLGERKVEELIKIANKYDECGEIEKANRIDELTELIKDNGKNFEDVGSVLKEYKETNDESRIDTGLAWKLISEWFGPKRIE